MKQKLLKTLVLLCALIVGTSSLWAADGLFYTLTPTSGTNSNYATNCDVTINGITWNLTGNSQQIPWRIGGKSLTMVDRALYSKTAISDNVTKIEVTHGAASSITVNSWTVIVSKNSDFSDPVSTLTPSFAASSTTTINRPDGVDWSSCYFKFIYNVTVSGSKNKFVEFSSAAFYKENGSSTIATPTFSVDGGTYTKAQSVELSCETDGATIYYTLDGSEPTESSTEYTSAIAVETTTTIKAKAFKGGEASGVASATYTILPVHHAGTVEDPYTVADARNAIDANTGLENVYVSGIVCAGDPSLSSGAMSYWISDDGLETDKFYIYKGKGLNGADFTATSDVQEGDKVVVYGKIMKYESTYEFDKESQLYSLDRPVAPRILTTPATISELDYVTGNGPSAPKTFTVSGSNLTADITLALSGTYFEMSLSEGSGYTNSLTLTQTAGAVDETTVYVRLKEGLEINDYVGTITLTSADATTKTIDLTGSVTPTLYTWDLSKKTYTTETDLVTWSSSYATMTNATATGETAATSYLGGDANNRTSSRFYKNNTLIITPALGYMITRVVFTATSENYASTLKSSAWTNATAEASGMTVTVTPTDGVSAIRATIGGACGFTAVKVYYQTATATINIAAACTDGDKCYGTYSNSKAFIVPADLTVYEVSVIGGEMLLEAYATGDIVPANTGVLVAGDAGDHNVMLTTGGTSKLDTYNMLRATGAGIDAAAMSEADANCKFYRLTMHKGSQIGFFWGAEDGDAFAVAANKAYLAVPNTEAGLVKGFRFGENTDAISEIMSNGENEKMSAIYDLSGRRVVKPTKGLYIVNGKKVVK